MMKKAIEFIDNPATMFARIVKAPSRRIFYIDIVSHSEENAEEYVK
jgi:hypothetical protein